MSALAQQILAALEAASSAEQHTRHRGEAQLAQLRSDAAAYFTACAEVLVSPTASLHGRQLVGYQLKNNLAHPACAHNAALQTAVCGHAVVDAHKSIRAVACGIISCAVRDGLWPVEAVVPQLTALLTQRGGEVAAVHGAVRALSQIVDDCVYLLDARQMTRAIVQAVLPFVMATHLDAAAAAAAGNHHNKGNNNNSNNNSQAATVLEVRAAALDMIVVVLEQAGLDFDAYTYRSMQDVVLSVIDACFGTLRSPPSNAIAAKCINCLVLSLAFHTQISDELFGTMVQLMYQATTSPRDTSCTDEQLHMEATTFWSAVLYVPRFAALAEAAMVRVIPALVRAMVYSDMEMSMLQASAEDWQVPDKVDTIRPRHYQARQQQQQHRPKQAQQQAQQSSSALLIDTTNNDDGDADEDEDDDEDDDDDDEVETWNLRRVSARTLDAMSEHYGERILTPVLSELDTMMQPTRPWRELEAAVLALGAICDGCFDSLTPHLPAISTRLLELLASPQTHFLVVNICLWTTTQIGRYIVATPALLQQFVHLVLAKMQSPSKLVQEGAASALERVTLLCDDGQLSTPAMASAVVTCIAQCLRGYQLKNRVLLFEVLETVCEHVGEALRSDAALVQTLLAPLGELWAATANDSPLLFPLFRCMSSVCTALGPAVQPMAPEMFDRAFGLLQLHMQQRVAAQQQQQQRQQQGGYHNDDEDDLAEPEFVITSADLLSGLFDALGSGLEPLLARHQASFMHVVLAMLRDAGNADIRQSGFSLVGDVAKTCPRYVQEVLPAVCDAALANVAADVVDEQTYGVVSNVAWALCCVLEHQQDVAGLPTLQGGAGNDRDSVRAHCAAATAQLFARLGHVLGRGELTADMRNMAENVALCLGMMLYTDADVEAKAQCGVDVFARRFCEYVRNIKDMPQKELALSGFVHALQRRCSDGSTAAATAALHVVVAHVTVFFDLACAIGADSADTQRAMRQLLELAKRTAPQVWQQRLAAYNAQLRAKLYHLYGLN